jgi:hypothetical protein
MLAQVLSSARALAFAEPISVTTQSNTVTFAKGIDFQVSARDTMSPISSAILVVTYTDADYQQQYPIMITNPSQSVALHWYLGMTQDNFLPAGAHVSYYWELQDKAGNSHNDVQQSFVVNDTRFAWQHLTAGQVELNWYNRPMSFGQSVLQQASGDIRHIGDDLGSGLQHPVNVWIYQSENDFRGALPPGTFEWVGGIAFPAFNQASFSVDSLNDDTLIRAMPHELTHLVFHQIIAQGISAPRWFDEGLAVYHQIYHEPEMALRLRAALARHQLLRLGTITLDFPADADQAYIAYAQSWNLASYMYATFGKVRMSVLVKAMNNSQQNFNQDLIQAIGMDQDHLENQWRLSLHQPGVLSSSNMQTPQVQQVSKPAPAAVGADRTMPLLIMLGVFLIIFPIFGLGCLFAYQRSVNRRKAQEEASRQWSYHTESNLARITTPMSTLHTTDPRGYAYPSRRPSGGMGESRRTQVDLPAIYLEPSAPANRANETGYQEEEISYIEYTNRFRDRSRSQE